MFFVLVKRSVGKKFFYCVYFDKKKILYLVNIEY